MSVYIPTIRVGKPLRYEALTVFPLFTEADSGVEYVLGDVAAHKGSIEVKEVSTSGSVPELLVENSGDKMVLLIEAEELTGAKQNRILNTSILVAAKSSLKIPVSCVEQGRWHYKSQKFDYSGYHSPSELRIALKKSVGRSLKLRAGHRSDQRVVWDKIEKIHAKLETSSRTRAMSDAFESHKKKIADFQKKLSYVKDAAGMVVAVGDKIIAMDVFDKPATCEKVWNRLLSGFTVDSISRKDKASKSVEVEDVEHMIDSTRNAKWNKVEAVGEGEEYRTEIDDDHGSALVHSKTLVHGSMLADQ
jgi:hypothetical protein